MCRNKLLVNTKLTTYLAHLLRSVAVPSTSERRTRQLECDTSVAICLTRIFNFSAAMATHFVVLDTHSSSYLLEDCVSTRPNSRKP